MKRANPPDVIICAAVRASNGKVVSGYRHNDAIRELQAMHGYEFEQPDGQNQGFVTSTNRFVNRREAYRLHLASGNHSREGHASRLRARSVQGRQDAS